MTAGANLNAQDVDGCTPLIWAAHNDYPEHVQLLLAAGADHSIKDKTGKTAREHAISTKLREILPLTGAIVVDPKEVNSEDFHWKVASNKNDVILLAYSPNCNHCTTFFPAYEKLTQALRATTLQFLQFDVSKSNLPESFHTDTLPAIFFSKKTTIPKKDGEQTPPALFKGNRESEFELMKWISASATNQIMVLNDGKQSDLPKGFRFDHLKDSYQSVDGKEKRPPPLKEDKKGGALAGGWEDEL